MAAISKRYLSFMELLSPYKDKVCAVLFNRNGGKLLLCKDDEVEWQQKLFLCYISSNFRALESPSFLACFYVIHDRIH